MATLSHIVQKRRTKIYRHTNKLSSPSPASKMQAAIQKKLVAEGDSRWTRTQAELSGITAAIRNPSIRSLEKQTAKRALRCKEKASTRKKRHRSIARKRKEKKTDHGAHNHNTFGTGNPAGAISDPMTNTVLRCADTMTQRRASGIEQSLLGHLPLELRQLIYGLVLGGDKSFGLSWAPKGFFCIMEIYWSCARFHRVALLRTCRQIHTEAIDPVPDQHIPRRDAETLTSLRDSTWSL